jgi:hypothetical protein
MNQPAPRRVVQRVLTILTALALPLIAAPSVSAAILSVYDLDSLAHLSSDIVEANVIGDSAVKDFAALDFEMTLIHKGSLEPGRTVSVVLATSYKKHQKSLRWENLKSGDHVVLFLRRAQPSHDSSVPTDAVLYEIVPGGMRLIRDGRVFAFSQQDNPGPYVSEFPRDGDVSKLPDLKTFRESTRQSMRNAEALHRLVEADAIDAPQLLKLLNERKRNPYSVDLADHFTERACVRLAELRDPAILDQALSMNWTGQEWQTLSAAFSTPAGLDYLLEKIADEAEPMSERARCTAALQWVGKDNHGIAIARLARTLAHHEELCCSLIEVLFAFPQNMPTPFPADRQEALAELKAFYDERLSERIQYAIERVSLQSPAAYEQLHSPCGNELSIVWLREDIEEPKRTPRMIPISYEFLSQDSDAEGHPVLVLSEVQTKQEHVVTAPWMNTIYAGGGGGGGSDFFSVPKDLPPGKYRVFLQFKDGDKVTSTGHFFTIDF